MMTEANDRVIEILSDIREQTRQQTLYLQEIRQIMRQDDGEPPASIIDETTPMGATIAERLRKIEEAA